MKTPPSPGKSLGSWPRRVVAIAAIASLSGCGFMRRNYDCALVGGGIGAAGGIIIEANNSGSEAEDIFLAGGLGILVGAAAGYGFCAVTGIGE